MYIFNKNKIILGEMKLVWSILFKFLIICCICWIIEIVVKFVLIYIFCFCFLFVFDWCLIIVLYFIKVGDFGVFFDGIWILIVLFLIVIIRSDCFKGMFWFVVVGVGGVVDNEKVYGEFKFVGFFCLLWDFIFGFLLEFLGFVICGFFVDKGGVGVDFEVVFVFLDSYL